MTVAVSKVSRFLTFGRMTFGAVCRVTRSRVQFSEQNHFGSAGALQLFGGRAGLR